MDASIREILKMSPGHVQSVAYDTAWVALLTEHAPDLAYPALQWLCSHQLPDGSWGAPFPAYYHDRLISTLITMIVLTRCGRRGTDRLQVDAGMRALENLITGATTGLYLDMNGATAGFEMIMPFLLSEGELLGLVTPQSKEYLLGQVASARNEKMAVLGGRLIDRRLTLAFSSELAGWEDWEAWLDARNLCEENGSVAHSPSATAYFAWAVKPGNKRALAYLRGTVLPDGGFPIAHPFEIYEIAWVLWNLALVPGVRETAEYQQHLQTLRQAWQPGQGVGFTKTHTIPDGDDTAMVASLLARQGERDPRVFQRYAEEDHFRCFPLEINASTSTNVHFLGALRESGYPLDDPHVQRALGFLKAAQHSEGYWTDKWHASAYYTTAHAILVCAGYCEDLVRRSVAWILGAQHHEGGWGFFGRPTAEETAYCLQALSVWRQFHKEDVPAQVLRFGADWLRAHAEPPYPPLWIAKSLYVSYWVARAEIASALALVEATL